MAVAKQLNFVGITPGNGRCPWRLDYMIDGLPVYAFFKPPASIASMFNGLDVALLAMPLTCHLTADVRPRLVSFSGPGALTCYETVFRSAVGALLLEQDAYWGRRALTDLPNVVWVEHTRPTPSCKRLKKRQIVLGFSGGKDSLVSLFSLIDAGYAVIPLLVNEGDRTWQDLRRWIPKLRGLGLAPQTAYLRIYSRPAIQAKYGQWHRSSYQIGWLTALLALTAEKLGAGVIALGLENSADRSGYMFRGKHVNHQHQKTTNHILELQGFFTETINPGLRIASPIAPFSDEEILRALFEGVGPNWRHFSSCGSSNSRSKHCGYCDKCAYVFALLARSEQGRYLAATLFRRNLFDDLELYRPWLDARYRQPMGCVGERWELWAALEDATPYYLSSPVIRFWENCSSRTRLGAARRRTGVSVAQEPTGLVQPVHRAATVISNWASRESRGL